MDHLFLLLEGYSLFKEIFYPPLWESLAKEIHFAFVLRLASYIANSHFWESHFVWEQLSPYLGGKSRKLTTHCGCHHNTDHCGALKLIFSPSHLAPKSRKSTTYSGVIIPSYIKYIAILIVVDLFRLNLTTPYLEGKSNS